VDFTFFFLFDRFVLGYESGCLIDGDKTLGTSWANSSTLSISR
jgi:hypothetical protein